MPLKCVCNAHCMNPSLKQGLLKRSVRIETWNLLIINNSFICCNKKKVISVISSPKGWCMYTTLNVWNVRSCEWAVLTAYTHVVSAGEGSIILVVTLQSLRNSWWPNVKLAYDPFPRGQCFKDDHRLWVVCFFFVFYMTPCIMWATEMIDWTL